jgi:hypothetical protein
MNATRVFFSYQVYVDLVDNHVAAVTRRTVGIRIRNKVLRDEREDDAQSRVGLGLSPIRKIPREKTSLDPWKAGGVYGAVRGGPQVSPQFVK